MSAPTTTRPLGDVDAAVFRQVQLATQVPASIASALDLPGDWQHIGPNLHILDGRAYNDLGQEYCVTCGELIGGTGIGCPGAQAHHWREVQALASDQPRRAAKRDASPAEIVRRANLRRDAVAKLGGAA